MAVYDHILTSLTINTILTPSVNIFTFHHLVTVLHPAHVGFHTHAAMCHSFSFLFFTDKYETVGEKLLKTYNVLRYDASSHVHFNHVEMFLIQ